MVHQVAVGHAVPLPHGLKAILVVGGFGQKGTHGRFWRKFHGIVDTLDDYLDGFGG